MAGKPHDKRKEEQLLLMLFFIGVTAWLLTGVFNDDRQKAKTIKVKRSQIEVIDGDTIKLARNGRTLLVRLLQIDAPEEGTCHADKSTKALKKFIEDSKKLRIKYDTRLDADRFDRLLVYLYDGNKNLNVKLVSTGAADTYYINGERGDYADKLDDAKHRAFNDARGVWLCSKPKLAK